MADIIGYFPNPFSFRSKVLRAIWHVTWLLLFRTSPRGFMGWWRVFLLRLFGAKVGKLCTVLPSVRIWAPWNLELEDFICLAADVECYCVDKIIVRRQAVVSQGTFLCTASHDFRSRNYDLIHKPIEIGRASWITAKVIVLPGVKIGEGAVVGAGAVVSKDVAPWTIVSGNPAKEIGKREFKEDK